jgi:toxin ParE1/3/4
MAKVVRSPQARRDFISIWQWIADDSPRAADRLLARFDKVSSLLATAPEMGRARA